ncbi:MAG: hypothetical protein HC815_36870, partial [Richelia sp. RM1_1_1]|nr:hypothetical protein [Richelia sp. RM1_1_1]
MFRSFERSNNASNVRVNQAVLNAATPAIDRARAKIDKLFSDPTLPRSTPSDNSLYNAFIKDLGKYTFGDETPLEVRYNLDGGSIDQKDDKPLEERETIKSAWRFPVDTDNNGKYDTFTLYGVYFRSPTRGNDGKFNRVRSPLDARTPPMDDGSLGGQCSAARGTSFSLIGDSGWYKSGANIKKSFFVYATNVPIDSKQIQVENLKNTDFEAYKGNKGFSALEFQQDQERVPLNNNAVVYEDDLEIAPGGGLDINGRIFTNSNLLTSRTSNSNADSVIRFYQVSNQNSCFYQAKNSKIIVGGNLGHGRINGTGGLFDVNVDLFKPGAKGGGATIKSSTKSVNNTSGDIAYNSQAYTQRINLLVEEALKTTTNPSEVQEKIDSRIKENPGLVEADVRREELESYFKKRTRKVPFAEVDFGTTPPSTVTLKDKGSDTMRGPDEWIYPFSITNNDTSYTKLKLYRARLEATEPNKLKEVNKEEEKYLGDRVLVGNNLPALWYDPKIKNFVGKETPQDVLPKIEWTDFSDEESKYRYRTTNIEQLLSLEGASERDGFFEIKAAQNPQNSLDNVGGMRVVTGAGIYVDGPSSDSSASYPWDTDVDTTTADVQPRSFLASSRPTWDTNFVGVGSGKIPESKLKFDSKDPIIVWPDTMPMTAGEDLASNLKVKGDLLMRATAVYHYKDNPGKDQTPVACVSSYYDPTDAIKAKNGLADWSSNYNAKGKSNNGIVYQKPYSSHSARLSAIGTYSKQLNQQARLVFPNGRFVNEPLRTALEKRKSGKTFSMADNSAIDTAVCAIRILDSTLNPDSSTVPHGAIYETAFLDAREIKSIEQDANVADSDANYTRSIEERQPLEVRVTVLDLEQLRKKSIGSGSPQEYLLPNSGIIYATRDDALRDLSHSLSPDDVEKSKLLSSSDYKLDSTRRPNGIMLIKGENLERKNTFRYEEKGLILASNVPAYIKGNFNLHYKSGTKTPVEEFKFQLRNDKTGEIDWSKFYDNSRNTLDDDFACRKGDPRLPSDKCKTGDSWRPATVVADAVTVLSDNFRFGFRDEGDYDLRNNQGDFKSSEYKKQGFFDNNFLTSSEWFDKGDPKDFDTTKKDYQGSSYLNNFVTPIQRRVEFGEYLMEVCTKIPVSTCEAADWSVDGSAGLGRMKATDQIGQTYTIATHKAGTTVDLSDSDLRRYARRVAFARKPDLKPDGITPDGSLVLDKNGHPVPLGIKSNKIEAFPKYEVEIENSSGKKAYNNTNKNINQLPDLKDNALWFRTTDSLPDKKLPTSTDYGYDYPLFYQTADGNTLKGNAEEQPLLVPVLQIHMPNKAKDKKEDNPPANYDELPSKYEERGVAVNKNWFQQATATTTNLTIAGGDTPARKTTTNAEANGGLENFIRYLEKWQEGSDENSPGINHSLSGSIIQYKRSAYATAPWQVVQTNSDKKTSIGTSIFGSDYELFYPSHINRTNGKSMTPFYTQPSRQWGFDVGLLSQIPDLFAQTFTLPPSSKPNEFFREVSRDDTWVKTLLCAKTIKIENSGKISSTNKNAISEDQRPKDFCKEYAGS